MVRQRKDDMAEQWHAGSKGRSCDRFWPRIHFPVGHCLQRGQAGELGDPVLVGLLRPCVGSGVVPICVSRGFAPLLSMVSVHKRVPLFDS